MKTIGFLICLFILSQAGFNQANASVSIGDNPCTISDLARQSVDSLALDSPPPPQNFVIDPDSLVLSRKRPTASSLAIQFLAGEAAFNITSFSLWGNDLYKLSSDNKLGVIGLLASTLTVPLAIHVSSDLLGLKEGSLGYSIGGAAIGLLIVSPAILLSGLVPKTYLGAYLGISLPIILVAELAYDLTLQ